LPYLDQLLLGENALQEALSMAPDGGFEALHFDQINTAGYMLCCHRSPSNQRMKDDR
jgi:hypothetical protein